jgi:hypothetical protein
MSHFSSISRMKYVPEANAVRLSIRSSDSHVEEFLIPGPDAVAFCGASDRDGWFGEGCLRGKRSNGDALLCIQLDYSKRTLFSMQRSVFDVMVSQMRAMLREAQVDGTRLIPSQVSTVKFGVNPDDLDYAKIAGAVSDRLMPIMQSMLSSIQVVTVPAPAPQPVAAQPVRTLRDAGPLPSTAVFIPTDVGEHELEGVVTVDKAKDAKSDAAKAAQALKAARKGRRKK